MSLDNALNFIKKYRNESYKIGIIELEVRELIGLYEKGDVVVFCVIDSRNNDKKVFRDIYAKKSFVTLEIETPYSPEIIKDHISKNIPNLSYNRITGVPCRCVREVENLNDL